MTTYRNTSTHAQVDAEQFDPHQRWPLGVVSWKSAGYQPRDMSWGYIETVDGKKHVQAHDWVVRDEEGIKLYKDEAFKATFELVEVQA